MMLNSNDMANRETDRWVRGQNGWVAGVCAGLAKSLGIETWIVRIMWLVSVLFLGLGLFVYFGLMFSLPLENQVPQAYQPKVLGVCNELSQRFHVEIGIVRFLALVLAVSSLGLTVVGYLILYLVFSKESGSTFKNTL